MKGRVGEEERGRVRDRTADQQTTKLSAVVDCFTNLVEPKLVKAMVLKSINLTLARL
jgi:hypothetical protein